jgi:hypothetical protein
MNDNIASDPAIDILRERVKQYETDIALHLRRAEIATDCRNDLLEVVATLSRRLRTKKPRLPAPVVEAPPTLEESLASLGSAVAANDAEAPEVAA